MTTEIQLRNLQKWFGSNQVIKDFDLTIAAHEFIVMLGQSGCGKTTTLRAIAGLESIDEGDILIEGEPVQHLKCSDRDIAMVFQSFSLYPHMTVYENIAFPLRATRMAKTELDAAVREIARVLQISDLLDKKPSALSGGDMQRVAIGRALVRQPKAMLMDEPIGALDAKLREQMRAEIKRLHIKQGSTTVYVTHDQVEAMSLADRIVIMHDGKLQQVGPPEEVYLHPANLFVAQFVGSPVMNIADIDIGSAGGGAEIRLAGSDKGFAFGEGALSGISRDAPVALGIRPEAVLLSQSNAKGHLPAVTTNIEPLGSHDIVDVKIGDQTLRARTESGFVGGEGQEVWVNLDPEQAHFFDRESGLSLRKAG
ncbi:MAG: ABC transporter ATP-binding protein [Rhizobiales bacterium]|nr:ABC transporter ATP-binding protein [Hyphomicrobiales bacterium]MBA68004.1 ABC transporter ATP-binding protein [Hyphomicrobiales bacterium]